MFVRVCVGQVCRGVLGVQRSLSHASQQAGLGCRACLSASLLPHIGGSPHSSEVVVV